MGSTQGEIPECDQHVCLLGMNKVGVLGVSMVTDVPSGHG